MIVKEIGTLLVINCRESDYLLTGPAVTGGGGGGGRFAVLSDIFNEAQIKQFAVQTFSSVQIGALNITNWAPALLVSVPLTSHIQRQ